MHRKFGVDDMHDLISALPRRIVITIQGLGAGGAEKTVSALASHWLSQGREVRIVTLEAPGTRHFHDLDARVEVEQLNLAPRRAALVPATRLAVARVAALRRTLRAARPDVVVSFLTRMNVLTLAAASGLGIAVVVSERNNPRAQPVGTAWSVARRLLYPRANGVTALTEQALAYYPRSVRRRGTVIPCAFALPEMPSRRTRPGAVLGAVGRLVDQKGFDLLIRAFALVAAEFPDWSLEIWGEGPERERLEALRDSLGLGDRIRLPGLTERPGGWLDEADAFVLSSRYEGLGNVIGEALAAGLPVAAFDCDFGPREFIRHEENGLLAPAGDVDALAGTIARLMGDPDLRARLGAAAREGMADFAPERVMTRWDSVIARAWSES
jgi:glycosyltransferase involved in cell wall biosynthesis